MGTVWTTVEQAKRPGPFRDGYVLAQKMVEGLAANEIRLVRADIRAQEGLLPHNSRKQQEFSGALAFLDSAA